MKGFIKKIEQIKFGLMSPEDIRAMSAVTVETPDTYEDDGFPIEKGLMDPRLGVIDPSLVCGTCGFRGGDCQGHFGSIELARPVIHIGFGDVIHKILRSTCNECGRILLDNNQIKHYTEKINELMDSKRYCGSFYFSDNSNSMNSILKEVYRVSKRELKQMPEDPDEEIDMKYCCPHCGAPQEAILLDKPVTIRQGDYKLTPSEVRERLERITDEDSFVLGVNPDVARPEWMVLTVLPVPPVTVRPSITLDTGERSEDDLTHKLVDILRINQRLLENMEAGAPQLIVEDLWELLQYHVTTYIDNEASGVPPARHRSGRPLKTLNQRLKGKEGRFRSNLSAKRVNFSARTVISPDPNISINEVGVPEMIAKEVTVPIFVTDFNIKEMEKYIMNGPDVYPGANYVIRNDGRKIRVRNEETIELILEQLEPGFIVERHLMDGDIVLFNRQPSLHRMTMMAHEVKVLPYKTFRLNLCVCPPYNADFDGDEMNMHILQSIEARAEAKSMMLVQEHILSPTFGGPIIGAIHDHISGAYILTREGSEFTEEQALQIIRKSHLKLPEVMGGKWVLKTDLDLKPDAQIPDNIEDSYLFKEKGAMWTGKELFSLLLPNDLNLSYDAEISKSPTVYPAEDATVVIKNGILLQGVIDESAYGSFSGKILDKIVKEYGPGRAKEFLDKSTKLAICGIMKTGITTSLNDDEIPEEVQDRINEHLKNKMAEVDKLVEAYEEGYLQPIPNRSLKETLEMKIMQVLAEARDIAGSIAENYLTMGKQSDDDPYDHVMAVENHSLVMARTGARASMLNLTQITACVGQQAVRGGRIERGYLKRTLPHFKKGELGAKAKGFVHSSYKSGLDPIEFFFHAMGGREGLVDTAIRTALSGYMQRRLVNALLDLNVDFNGVVRDNNGNVIQTLYGDDGVDPVKSDFGKVADLNKLIDEIRMEENLSDEEINLRNLKSEVNNLLSLYKELYKKVNIESEFFEDNNLVHDFGDMLLEVDKIINNLNYTKNQDDLNYISDNVAKYNQLYASLLKEFDKKLESAINLNKYFFKQEVIDKTNNFKEAISQIINSFSNIKNKEQLILNQSKKLFGNVDALEGNFTQNLENERTNLLNGIKNITEDLSDDSQIEDYSSEILKVNQQYEYLMQFDRVNDKFSSELDKLDFYIDKLQNKINGYETYLNSYEFKLKNYRVDYENLIRILKDKEVIFNQLMKFEDMFSQFDDAYNNHLNKLYAIQSDVSDLTNKLVDLGNNLDDNLLIQKNNILNMLNELMDNLELNKGIVNEFINDISSAKMLLDKLMNSSRIDNTYNKEFSRFESQIYEIQNNIVDFENKLNNFEEELNVQKSNYDKLIENLNEIESDDSETQHTDDIYDQLIKFNELLKLGIITQEDFDELKRKLIYGNNNEPKKEENEFLNQFKNFINSPFYRLIRNSVDISEDEANTILNDIESEIIEGKLTEGNIRNIVKGRFEEYGERNHVENLTKKLVELVNNSSFYRDLSLEYDDLSFEEKSECITQIKDSFDSNFKEEDIESTLKIIFENKRKEKHDLNLLNGYKSNIIIHMSKYNLLENEVRSIFEVAQYDIMNSNLIGKDFDEYMEDKFETKVNENKKEARFELNLFLNKRSKIRDLTGLNDNQIELLSNDLTLLISKNKLRKQDITEELFVEKSFKYKTM